MDTFEIEQVAAMCSSPVSPRRKDIHINCPFGSYHSKGIDSSQGLSVKIAPGGSSLAYCFSCGASGSLGFVFEEAAKLDPSYLDVAQFISQNDGPSLSGALARLHGGEHVPNEVPANDWTVYASRAARRVPRYLVERGIVKADVRRWQLGFDEELQRAIFPVRDEDGVIVGCLRRAVHDDQQPKYKDTPGASIWKKDVFYGEHRIDRTLDTAYVIEGPMGVIFAARQFTNVLGMHGADTGIEGVRLAKLQRWGIKTVVLMLDSDKKGTEAVYGRWLGSGRKREWKPGLRDTLRPFFIVKVAKLPPREDPDDVVRRDPTALLRIVSAAVYLEAPKHLTGESASASVPPPQQGSTFMGYMINRRTKRLENDGGVEQ